MNFRIEALDAAAFAPLFDLDDAALAARHAQIVIADSSPGFPCRVSLQDAAIGERLLLINHEHLGGATPYRSRHAIFVREHAETAAVAVGSVPESLQRRLLSLRAFDAAQRMVEADVVEGRDCVALLQAMLARPDTRCVHLHTARQGCYLARAVPRSEAAGARPSARSI
jgi:hypothetical protein